MFFYAVIDSSLYKTCDDKDGESENSVIITPRLAVGKNCTWNSILVDIDTFSWQVLKVNSNFGNAINKKSFAQVNALTPTNEQFVAYEVSNLQEGEVVFLQVACAIDDSGRVGDLSDYDSRHGNIIVSNQVAYRGDPINTRFKIWTAKNGKLEEDYIYDNPIEKTIQSANKNWGDFFAPLEMTANGGKENIQEFLARWATVAASANTDFNSRPNDAYLANTNGKGVTIKTRTSISFARDEILMYAHGRSLDLESIKTLVYQNPSNSNSKGSRREPSAQLYIDALNNRRRQAAGYNSFVSPMLNPYFIGREPTLLHFPNRSSHGGGSGGGSCYDVTMDLTWTPPGYPECPGLSYDSASPAGICEGSDSQTLSYCIDEPCTHCP